MSSSCDLELRDQISNISLLLERNYSGSKRGDGLLTLWRRHEVQSSASHLVQFWGFCIGLEVLFSNKDVCRVAGWRQGVASLGHHINLNVWIVQLYCACCSSVNNSGVLFSFWNHQSLILHQECRWVLPILVMVLPLALLSAFLTYLASKYRPTLTSILWLIHVCWHVESTVE